MHERDPIATRQGAQRRVRAQIEQELHGRARFVTRGGSPALEPLTLVHHMHTRPRRGTATWPRTRPPGHDRVSSLSEMRSWPVGRGRRRPDGDVRETGRPARGVRVAHPLTPSSPACGARRISPAIHRPRRWPHVSRGTPSSAGGLAREMGLPEPRRGEVHRPWTSRYVEVARSDSAFRAGLAARRRVSG
jgi:hypothetical protein